VSRASGSDQGRGDNDHAEQQEGERTKGEGGYDYQDDGAKDEGKSTE
jgi:hypothetical protein